MSVEDDSSRRTWQVLDALAACNERFVELSRNLRARKGVVTTLHTFDIRRYASGSEIEVFVDAELSNGKAIVWGLEIGWSGGQWVVDHYVRLNDSHGQYPVHEFPARTAATIDAVLVHIEAAVEELMTLAREADLCEY